MTENRIYRAKWIVTLDKAPIQDGAIVVSDGRIIDIGEVNPILKKYSDLKIVNLGNFVLMPALVNAHSHVAFSDAEGLIDGINFLDWLMELIRWRLERSSDEIYRSSVNGIQRMFRAGITTIGDSYLTMEPIRATLDQRCRCLFFHEVFGSRATIQQLTVMKYNHQINRRRKLENSFLKIGISPHAPYTVTPSVLRFSSRYSSRHNLRLSMHVAESEGEIEFLSSTEGKYRKTFTPNVNKIPPTRLLPLEYVSSFGLLSDKFLVIHGVHLTETEFEILARHSGHLVSCPSSNSRLKAGRLDISKPYKAMVNTCVGTDSLASSDGCDLFKELRMALRIGEHDEIHISSRDALAMITSNPAKALGFESDVGSLEIGKAADFIALEKPSEITSWDENIEEQILRYVDTDDVVLTVSMGEEKYKSDSSFT